MSATSLILAAAALGVAAGDSPPADAPPITLVTDVTPAGVLVQVVGRAAAPVAARYVLEVESGPSGGNRSVQSGAVRLTPGTPAVLLTTRLGGAAERNWSARLHVEPEGGRPYEIARAAE